MVVLALESFDRRLVLDQSGNNVSIGRIVLASHDDIVTVEDSCVDHRVAMHFEHDHRTGANELLGEGKHFFDVFFGQDRRTGGDPAHERNVTGRGGCPLRRIRPINDLDCTGFGRIATQIAESDES